MSEQLQKKAQIEAIKYIYSTAAFSILGNAVIVLLFFYLFWDIDNKKILYLGVGLHFLALSIRVLLVLAYKKIDLTQNTNKLHQWILYYTLATTMSGFLWGMSFVLIPMESKSTYTLFVAATLAGVAGAGLSTLSSHLKTYLSFLLVMMLPFNIWVFLQEGKIYLIVSILMLILIYFYYNTAKQYQNNFLNTIIEKNKAIETQKEIIARLSTASELKDNETGMHIKRMSYNSYIIAKYYTNDYNYANQIHQASAMHDVGKIGIPDSILLKEGPLDNKEWEIMKSHTIIGKKLLQHSDSQLLKLSENIAYTHHEKYDGTGYPQGLKGKEIPLEGRIVAMADVFDALVSKRPYKEAWSYKKTFAFIEQESGKHFDPELVKVFLAHKEKIIGFHQNNKDIL